MKAILWDLDSTLLDPTLPQRIAVAKCFELFGFGECSSEQLDMYPKFNNELWVYLNDGSMTKEQIVVERFVRFLKYCGKDYTKAEEFNNAYTERMGTYIYPCPNAIETVKKLQGKVRQCVATNGLYRAQIIKLRNSGLDKIVDDIFVSETVGYDKPQKEYYDFILDKIGIQDRRSVMMVGDALDTDMQGGVNAGIVTCWYNPKHKINDFGLKLDYEISDIAQVLDIVKTI